jgi:hypothetical protein
MHCPNTRSLTIFVSQHRLPPSEPEVLKSGFGLYPLAARRRAYSRSQNWPGAGTASWVPGLQVGQVDILRSGCRAQAFQQRVEEFKKSGREAPWAGGWLKKGLGGLRRSTWTDVVWRLYGIDCTLYISRVRACTWPDFMNLLRWVVLGRFYVLLGEI